MRTVRALLLILFFCLAASAEQPVNHKYTIQLAGNNAGFQEVRQNGEIFRIHYEFNDRGRGPKLDAEIKLNSSGLPFQMDIRGVDYYKGEVQETFTWSDGKASWQNKAEKGEKQLTRPAFYTSFSGIPYEYGLLARALTRDPKSSLPLLPEGEVRIERIGDRTISNGQGKRVKLILWAMYGLEFVPAQVWLEESGEFFGSTGGWFGVIREGWESSISELAKIHDDFQVNLFRDLAKKLVKPSVVPIVFRGANVFDSGKGAVHQGWSVVITGNRITKTGPDSEVQIPEGARVIDAAGKMLLPGLYDMHVHIGDSDGPLHLAAGVTSVRDMANDTEKLLKLKSDYESLATLGPRITAAGFIDSPGPYQGPSKVLVSTEAEARTAVDQYARQGYVQIKIYSSLKPELVPAIIDEAHKKGLRVSGHIPASMFAEQLVRMGMDEIQHENMLVLNFLKDVLDTRTPARFTAVADRAAELNLNSKEVQDFISLLKEKRTVIDPTVNVFENMFTDRPGIIPEGYASVAGRLPTQVRRGFLSGGLPVPEGKDQRYKDSWKAMLQLLKRLYDEGITIVPGTDALAGFSLHRELELYEQAGIPAPEVLRIATIVPARVLHQDKDLGSIEPGKLADMILVEGDPSRKISDIRNVRMVMKNGILLDPNDLYAALGVSH